MQQAVSARSPAHLWIVGILALLWNGLGAYDYLMTRMHNTDYLRMAMPEVDPQATLAWIDSMPIYVQVGWGLGVWLGLLGSALLLLRNRWAVPSFGLSLLGSVVSLGYQLALAPPLPGAEGFMVTVFPYIIMAVALALFLYARAQAAKGVLR
jgi:hypothetical protein